MLKYGVIIKSYYNSQKQKDVTTFWQSFSGEETKGLGLFMWR